jgi:hypothetical protein
MSMQAIVVGLVLAAHSHQRSFKRRPDLFADWLSFIARFSVVGEPPAACSTLRSRDRLRT